MVLGEDMKNHESNPDEKPVKACETIVHIEGKDVLLTAIEMRAIVNASLINGAIKKYDAKRFGTNIRDIRASLLDYLKTVKN